MPASPSSAVEPLKIERELGNRYSVVRTLTRHSLGKPDVTSRYLHPSYDELRAPLEELAAMVLGDDNVIRIKDPEEWQKCVVVK